MKILVTGGGTAGHITPLLAVVSNLKTRYPDSKVYYIGNFGDSLSSELTNSDLVNKSGKILSGKLRRFHGKKWYWYLSQPLLILRNIRDLVYLFIGTVQSIFYIISWSPDVVFVKGGFVGLPVGIAAGLLKKPLVTHDSDVMPGLTNRLISRFATIHAVGMPVENYKYPKSKMRYTGVPVRPEFIDFSNRKTKSDFGFKDESKPLLLVIGGSLGAVRLNNAFLSCIRPLVDANINIYWVTGAGQFTEILNETGQKYTDNLIIKAYTDKTAELMANADIVISRAGATAMAELSILAKPTILVPNPYLTGGHQLKNAEIYEKAEAAVVVNESVITNPEVLVKKVKDLMNDSALRQKLSYNIHKFAITDGADKIVTVLVEIAGNK